MSVSVVIPCFNSENYIGTAIESVLTQNASCEAIVVDDGSTDKSWDVIRGFGEKITAIKQTNMGAPRARNKGVTCSKYDFIKFLDADDFLEPGAIEAQMRFREENNLAATDVNFGDYFLFDEIAGVITQNHWRIGVGSVVCIDWLLFHQIMTSTPIYSKSSILAVNGFREDLARGQEFDLNIRLQLEGCRFLYDSVKIYSYRHHSGEGRLSSSKIEAISNAQFKMICGWIDKIHKYPVPELDMHLSSISKYSWKVGRSLVQRDHLEVAKLFFDLSKKTSPDEYIFGGALYRALVHLVSPVAAERLGAIKDSICKRNPRFNTEAR